MNWSLGIMEQSKINILIAGLESAFYASGLHHNIINISDTQGHVTLL